MANFMQMMQKAQGFKVKMQALQERVGGMTIAGASAQGKVACQMSGKGELKSLKIDPALINAGEADIMEDLIVAAVNDARAKTEKIMADETQKLMQELGLPPGMGLPF